MTTRHFVRALAFAAILMAPAAASAEEFTLFIYETPADIAVRSDTGANGADYWKAYADFGALLGGDGALKGGAPLVPDLSNRTADGLVLGGYFRVEAKTLAQARAYAAASPSSHRGGRTVVAQHAPAPGMSEAR